MIRLSDNMRDTRNLEFISKISETFYLILLYNFKKEQNRLSKVSNFCLTSAKQLSNLCLAVATVGYVSSKKVR